MIEIKCDKCGKTNTEFFTIPKSIDLVVVNERSKFEPVNSAERVIKRYVELLLKDGITTTVNICQSCMSKGFRSFKKNK